MAFNRTLQHFTSSQELATQWASGQSYILDQLVLESDKLYRCILAHTSGATFAGDSAYWSGINPGQTISIANGGTGQTTQTAAFDALAPTTTAGDLIVHNGTDNVRQGIGTDGQVLVVDTAQTNKLKWATIQQGSKNYIANSTFENGVTPPSSWSTFSTTIDSTTKIPSGSVTPDPTITLATSLSTPLAGTYSMLASSGAVTITTTGYGFISSAFTIDREDQAKAMGFSFYYEAASGTMNFSGTSSNTFAVYIRDVSGGAWIQPAGVYNLVQSSGVGLCSGTFQTTASGTQYQMAVLMINTVSAGVSMRFDDFQLGPQATVQGAAISDWVSYTPTITAGQGTIVPLQLTGKYRRVGDSAQVVVSYDYSSGTGAAVTFALSLPFPYEASKSISNGMVGEGFYYTGAAGFKSAAARLSSGSSIVITKDSGAFLQGTDMDEAGAGTSLTLTYPVQGWSSNTVLSQDTDTRVVAAKAFKNASSGTQTIAALTGPSTIVLNETYFDTHAAYSTASNSYVFPVSGIYKVSAKVIVRASVASSGYIRLTGTGILTDDFSFIASSAGDHTFDVYSIISADAGDTVSLSVRNETAGASIQILSTATWSGGTSLSIERLSGPATIAASETVAASAGSSAGGSLADTIFTYIDFPTTAINTHNAVLGAGSGNSATYTNTWRFIAPISGIYSVSANLTFVQAAATTSSLDFLTIVARNGSSVLYGQRTLLPATLAGAPYGSNVSGLIRVNAGDAISIIGYQDNPAGTTRNLEANSAANYVSIVRVGN